VQEWGELEQLFGKLSAADLPKADLPFSSMASRVLI
jgi:hypothetical protein